MFKVTVKGFNGVKQQFISAKQDILKIIEQEQESMAQNWVAAAKRDAPADQGDLRRSISYLKINRKVEIIASAFYAPFMEFGTKGKYQSIPGTEAIANQFKGIKNGDIGQMIRMIVRWVHRKGITGTYSVKTKKRTGSRINQYAEDYKAAWPIVMSILKNGVKPHPFFFKQMNVVWPEMIRKIEKRLNQDMKVKIIPPSDQNHPKIITI